jgi:membrane-bound ClpP family serine protease
LKLYRLRMKAHFALIEIALPFAGLLVLVVGGILLISGDFSAGLPRAVFLACGLALMLFGAVVRTDCPEGTRVRLAGWALAGIALLVGTAFVGFERGVYQITVVNATGETLKTVSIVLEGGEIMGVDDLPAGGVAVVRTRTDTQSECGEKRVLAECADWVAAEDYVSCNGTFLGYTDEITVRHNCLALQIKSGRWFDRLVTE